MREIAAATIADTVARLVQEANRYLPDDVQRALERAHDAEESPAGRRVLAALLENARIAAAEGIPICQDTGAAILFIELGQEAHIVGDLAAALTDGVSRGYRDGYLRASMVTQPFTERCNSGDNTPPIVHVEIVAGDRLRIRVLPKGAGCENMSQLAMLKPADGRAGVVEFVVGAVERAGSNPCPPLVVGVGVGGTADYAMLLAKRALLRPVGEASADPETAALEAELLTRINDLGIGPQGYGGRITALAVHIEAYPTHIASLPVAVCLQCHAARSREATL